MHSGEKTKIPSSAPGIFPFHCATIHRRYFPLLVVHRIHRRFPDVVGIDPVDVPVEKVTSILLNVRKDVILPLESFNLFVFGKKDGLQAGAGTGNDRNEFSETTKKTRRKRDGQSEMILCVCCFRASGRSVSRVVVVVVGSFLLPVFCPFPLLASFWIMCFPA